MLPFTDGFCLPLALEAINFQASAHCSGALQAGMVTGAGWADTVLTMLEERGAGLAGL